MTHHVSQEQIDAVERLIALSNPDAGSVTAQIAEFRGLLKDEGEEIKNGTDLIWQFKNVVDWQSGFFVDWKDTESFVQCLDQLGAARGVEIDWGVEDAMDDDFLDSVDVEELMSMAAASLAGHDLTLWNWDTEGDDYGGWIARAEDDEEIAEIARCLDVDFSIAEAQLDDEPEDGE